MPCTGQELGIRGLGLVALNILCTYIYSSSGDIIRLMMIS